MTRRMRGALALHFAFTFPASAFCQPTAPIWRQSSTLQMELHRQYHDTVPLGTMVTDVSAADLNGDGADELLLSVQSLFSPTLNVRVISSLDGRLLNSIMIPQTSLVSSAFVVPGNDFDGDGINDILVGVLDMSTVYAFSSRNSSLLFSRTVVDTSTFTGSQFGSGLTSFSDVTGDGVDEIAVGAPGVNGFSGEVQIYSVATQSLVRTIAVPNSSGLGKIVKVLPDINGDSRDDLLVASYDSQVRVFSGVDGSVIYQAGFGALPGTSPDVKAIEVLGDIDSDGYADFAVAYNPVAGGIRRAGEISYLSGASGALMHTFAANSPSAEGNLYFVHVKNIGDYDLDGVDDAVLFSNAVTSRGFEGFTRVVSGRTLQMMFTETDMPLTDIPRSYHLTSIADPSGSARRSLVLSHHTLPTGGPEISYSVWSFERVWQSTSDISTATGGTIRWEFDYGTGAANNYFLLVGSETGTSGFSLL
ncbi:MAG: FG-GAP repeat protein, partial [Bdellovibrionales bacterium]|nr:FG-GAP repeat protein [Bdellovibrionales bacterium]